MIRLVIAVGLLLALLLFALVNHVTAQVTIEEVRVYEGIPLDMTLLHADKRALEDAYHDHLVHLFTIWLAGQARSTTEITNGIRLARRAYNVAAAQIARREQELLDQDRRGQDAKP